MIKYTMRKAPALIRIILIVLLCAFALSCATPEKSPEELARMHAFVLTSEAFDKHWGKDWNRVVELATEAIAADTEYPFAYAMRGAAYAKLNKPGLAIDDLDAAIALNPEFRPAYINRGVSYMDLGDMDAAREDFERALELDQDDMAALVRMAEVLTYKDDVLLACQYLQKAIALGFTDMDLLEREPNFKGLMFSDCYDDLRMEELQRREFQKLM